MTTRPPAAFVVPLLALFWLGASGWRLSRHAGRADSVASPGATHFALRVYDQLRAQPGNLLFSPPSVRLALAMAYGGARGATATQLRDALDLRDGDAAHAEMADSASRWEAMATPSSARHPIVLEVADRLWVARDLPLEPNFLALVDDYYRASIARLDFADSAASTREINRWVDARTQHMIPALLEGDALDERTPLVLTNAVYFAGDWARPFDEARTQTTFFHAPEKDVTSQLMRAIGHFQYAQFSGGQLLELPYGDGEVVLDVLLPTQPEDMMELEDRLVAGSLPRWLALASVTRVDVALPRFTASWRGELTPVLRALGMTLPFSSAADFSGISRARPHLAEVVHQAVIAVHEKGTRAAAATAVVMARPSAHREPTPVIFRADHPFVYAIRSRFGNDLLFLGRLVDPSGH